MPPTDVLSELGRGEAVHREGSRFGLGGTLRHARLGKDQQPSGKKTQLNDILVTLAKMSSTSDLHRFTGTN